MHNIGKIDFEIDLLAKSKQIANVIWGTNALGKTWGRNARKRGYWQQSSITFVRA